MKWKLKSKKLLAITIVMVMTLSLLSGLVIAEGDPTEVWIATDGDDNNDGTQDNPFETIQKGINEVADNGTVKVQEGTYEGDLLIDKKNLTLKSKEEHTATIEGLIDVVSKGVTLDGFKMRNYQVPGGGEPVINVNAANVTIQNMDLYLEEFIGNQPYEIRIQDNADNANIMNNIIDRGWNGGHPAISIAQGADGVIIEGNVLGETGPSPMGIGVGENCTVTVRDNIIHKGYDEGIFFWPVDSTGKIIVEGNTIHEVGIDKKDLKIVNRPNSVNGQTNSGEMLEAIYSDNPGIASVELTWAMVNDEDSIQEAINAAMSGDTVWVDSGTYNENLVIDGKEIILLSFNGRDETIIEPITLQTNAIELTGNTTGVQIGAEGQGFTILGAEPTNQAIETAAVYLQGPHSGIKLEGNKISAGGDYAVLTEWSAEVSDFEMTGNKFSGQTFLGTPIEGDQFEVFNVPRPAVYIGGNNKSNIFFNDNVVEALSGELDEQSNPVGRHIVDIDADGITVNGNIFEGNTAGESAILRARGTITEVKNNEFNSGPLLASHIWAPEVADDDSFFEALLENNTFDKLAFARYNPVVNGILYTTIQDAVDAAIGSQESEVDVEIEDGEYEENITIPSSSTKINLKASDGAVLKAADENQPAIIIEDGASSVEIDNLTIETSGIEVENNSNHISYTKLSMNFDKQEIVVGDTFELQINIENISNMRSYEVEIDYDPEYVVLKDVSRDFSGDTIIEPISLDDSQGKVKFGAILKEIEPDWTKTSGRLATITFEATQPEGLGEIEDGKVVEFNSIEVKLIPENIENTATIDLNDPVQYLTFGSGNNVYAFAELEYANEYSDITAVLTDSSDFEGSHTASGSGDTGTADLTIEKVWQGTDYKLSLNAKGFLGSVVENVEVEYVGDTQLGEANDRIVLLFGDLNDQGRINILDVVLLGQKYGQNTNELGEKKYYDITGSGNIEVTDIQCLVNNYGKNTVNDSTYTYKTTSPFFE